MRSGSGKKRSSLHHTAWYLHKLQRAPTVNLDLEVRISAVISPWRRNAFSSITFPLSVPAFCVVNYYYYIFVLDEFKYFFKTSLQVIMPMASSGSSSKGQILTKWRNLGWQSFGNVLNCCFHQAIWLEWVCSRLKCIIYSF